MADGQTSSRIGIMVGAKEPIQDGTDERWTAVVARDRTAIGRFVYAVRSTGVYCRPGCASRLPNRKNVRFFDSWAQAEAAGYRACKRCRPKHSATADSAAEQLIRACRFIDQSQSASLREIAGHVGLSPHYLHRVFRRRLGVTPKQYASARRTERLKVQLSLGEPVTRAIYAAGFATSGRCYAQAAGILGMTPKQFRDRGKAVSIRFATAACDLGRVLVAVTERGVCQIALGESDAALRADLLTRFPAARRVAHDRRLAELLRAVVSLIESPTAAPSFPLDIRGTAFQQQVWLALQSVPPGKTLSYSELAAAIGRPRAVRAVASAVAANALAVAVPCHRVIRSDGGLGGYRWGTERKKALLERERPDRKSAGTR
jgi:AraC family transcriptional regulator of adaptative response/methylated-DNA-[protein]-cysteine methyltransferase